MIKYFFDFRSGSSFSEDEEGLELSDIEAAHNEAVRALGEAVKDVLTEGIAEQHAAVEVRDEYGPVLEVSAVLRSKILRKQ
jgi:hypothetical protein